MNLPCYWSDGGLADFSGCVRFRRRFGYPGRIDPNERVWMTFAGAGDRAKAILNDVALGRAADGARGAEYEVTSLLRPRNDLVVDVEGGGVLAGLWGEVALEVRRTAYLRNICIEINNGATLRVRGEAVGQSARPLELYAVVDRLVSAYETVVPGASGTRFELTAVRGPSSGTESGGTSVVQVDLVDGAVVWYTWVQAISAPPGPGAGG